MNSIIEEIKQTLLKLKKKYYTFLLGKITEEKLANFVDYIDCFILIACPFSSFYDSKALMKPIVSPLDIKMAFDSNFVWNLTYSLDNKFILQNKTVEEINEKHIDSEPEVPVVKFTGLLLKEYDKLDYFRSEKNQALAKIFSINVLEKYDSKSYKGLENTRNHVVSKFSIGKTGIPIQYEDIQQKWFFCINQAIDNIIKKLSFLNGYKQDQLTFSSQKDI